MIETKENVHPHQEHPPKGTTAPPIVVTTSNQYREQTNYEAEQDTHNRIIPVGLFLPRFL
jgi:hypothetical protein